MTGATERREDAVSVLASLLGMSREEETACRVEVANARRAASSSSTFGSYVPEVDLG